MRLRDLKNSGFEIENNIIKKNYDGFQEIVEAVKDNKGDYNAPIYWAGDTFEGAYKKYNYGNFENVKKFSAVLNEIKSDMFSPSVAYRWDCEGACFDVGEYLAGVPECFINRIKCDDKKSINIFVAVGVDSQYTLDEATNRGAIICALVDLLQGNNYGVNLKLYETIRTKKTKSGNFKNYQLFFDVDCNPVDIDLLATVCGDVSFCRQLLFAYINKINRDYDLQIPNNLPYEPLAVSEGVQFSGLPQHREKYKTSDTSKNTLQEIINQLELGTKKITA